MAHLKYPLQISSAEESMCLQVRQMELYKEVKLLSSHSLLHSHFPCFPTHTSPCLWLPPLLTLFWGWSWSKRAFRGIKVIWISPLKVIHLSFGIKPTFRGLSLLTPLPFPLWQWISRVSYIIKTTISRRNMVHLGMFVQIFQTDCNNLQMTFKARSHVAAPGPNQQILKQTNFLSQIHLQRSINITPPWFLQIPQTKHFLVHPRNRSQWQTFSCIVPDLNDLWCSEYQVHSQLKKKN